MLGSVGGFLNLEVLMKIVGLNYLTVEELIDDINDASLSHLLVATVSTTRGFTALVRVSHMLSKSLLKRPAARRDNDTTQELPE